MRTAKKIEEIIKTGTMHQMYREDGKWYHHLVTFPGTLFDNFGFIMFQTEHDYRNCNFLQHTEDLHVPKGISAIPGYKKFSEDELIELKRLDI